MSLSGRVAAFAIITEALDVTTRTATDHNSSYKLATGVYKNPPSALSRVNVGVAFDERESGQVPKTIWPEGCFAFLGPAPFSATNLFTRLRNRISCAVRPYGHPFGQF